MRISALEQEYKIYWLRNEEQPDINSASELGRELLRLNTYEIVEFPKNILNALRARAIRKYGSPVYYQISSPSQNFIMCLNIIIGNAVIVHYLDHVQGGYPLWVKLLGASIFVKFLLNRAHTVICISPAMKSYLHEKTKRNDIRVYYRVVPDDLFNGDYEDRINNSIVFVGNINKNTNLVAIINNAKILEKRQIDLHIFTRSKDLVVLDQLNTISNIKLYDQVDSKDVVRISRRYAAQLLPFNLDSRSIRFYKYSTPSKIPNIIQSARPVIYSGPTEFWFSSWMKKNPKYFFCMSGVTDIEVFRAMSFDKEYINSLALSFENIQNNGD